MTNLVDIIWNHAQQQPEANALREGVDEAERIWSYDRLARNISGVIPEFQRRGIQPGDRVLFVVPTSAEFVLAYHALAALGAIAVTVNAACTARELQYFIEDSEPVLALGWKEDGKGFEQLEKAAEATDVSTWLLEPGVFDDLVADSLAEPADLADGTPMAILYTSGTTGRPKGAVLTHNNIMACGRMAATTNELGSSDSLGTGLPMFHVFAQVAVMHTVFHGGASLSLLRPFTPHGMMEMMVKHQLTSASGVPTMWNAMLHVPNPYRPEDFSNMQKVTSGGAALPIQVAKKFYQAFGGDVIEGYGLTETTGYGIGNRPHATRKEGSIGLPVEGVDVTILDDNGQELGVNEIGEIALDGPVVMKEYWGRPDATAATFTGRWFRTGDLGRIDEDGYVFIVDRKKDLIIRGGYNVYPREVEEVLYTHPDVVEAAVAGVPDEHLGEEIAAVITLRPDATPDAPALKEWLGEYLAHYKIPRIYHFVESLPKGATGKILKRAIDRDELRDQGVRVSSAPQRS